MDGYIKLGIYYDKKGKVAMARCEECFATLRGNEISVYKKRILCEPCIRKLKRRGA